MSLKILKRDEVFNSEESKAFPSKFVIDINENRYKSDVTVIIAIHGNDEDAISVINNYRLLERELKLHFIIVNTSLFAVSRVKQLSTTDITTINLISPVPQLSKLWARDLYASNSVGFTAQIGEFFSQSDLIFFSHADMMGYKKNFLSYLVGKLNEDTEIASFTQRHFIPFTGCMLYKRSFVETLKTDWLPQKKNNYDFSFLGELKQKIENIAWIDCGEDIIYKTMNSGKKQFVCRSFGISGDSFGDPNFLHGFTNKDFMGLRIPITYEDTPVNICDIKKKFTELNEDGNSCWRKTVDHDGDIIFIHRGRGTTNQKVNDGRGDFKSFLNEFNKKISK